MVRPSLRSLLAIGREEQTFQLETLLFDQRPPTLNVCATLSYISYLGRVGANLSLGQETYMPARLLYGLLPHTLLENYIFWQV